MRPPAHRLLAWGNERFGPAPILLYFLLYLAAILYARAITGDPNPIGLVARCCRLQRGLRLLPARSGARRAQGLRQGLHQLSRPHPATRPGHARPTEGDRHPRPGAADGGVGAGGRRDRTGHTGLAHAVRVDDADAEGILRGSVARAEAGAVRARPPRRRSPGADLDRAHRRGWQAPAGERRVAGAAGVPRRRDTRGRTRAVRSRRRAGHRRVLHEVVRRTGPGRLPC